MLAEGLEEVECLAAVDVMIRCGIEVKLISMSGSLEVAGSHGLRIVTDMLWEDSAPEEADCIFLPGGMPGTKNLDSHAGVQRVVKDFFQEGKKIGAICAAPTVLSNLGLLKGKRVTCYPGVEKDIQGAALTGAPVTVDGNLITSQGVGTAIDFSLKLIEVLVGKEKADEIAESIVYERK